MSTRAAPAPPTSLTVNDTERAMIIRGLERMREGFGDDIAYLKRNLWAGTPQELLERYGMTQQQDEEIIRQNIASSSEDKALVGRLLERLVGGA